VALSFACFGKPARRFHCAWNPWRFATCSPPLIPTHPQKSVFFTTSCPPPPPGGGLLSIFGPSPDGSFLNVSGLSLEVRGIQPWLVLGPPSLPVPSWLRGQRTFPYSDGSCYHKTLLPGIAFFPLRRNLRRTFKYTSTHLVHVLVTVLLNFTFTPPLPVWPHGQPPLRNTRQTQHVQKKFFTLTGLFHF